MATSCGLSTSASESAIAATQDPENAIELDGEWMSPSPEKGTYKSRSEYLQLKAKLATAAARAFRAVAVRLRDTPITVKELHPAFKPKQAVEPPLEDGWQKKKRATLKGEWGDVMSIEGADLIGKLEEQEAAERRLLSLGGGCLGGRLSLTRWGTRLLRTYGAPTYAVALWFL